VELDRLEGEPGGRCPILGQHLDGPTPRLIQDGPAVRLGETRLLAKGEKRPHLDPFAAVGPDLLDPTGVARSTRDPEWEPQVGDPLEVDEITITVDRLAPVVQRLGTAGRGVVSTSGGALDDKAIDPSVRLPGQDHGQGIRRHDREKTWPVRFVDGPSTREIPGIEDQLLVLGSRHVQAEAGRLVTREPIQGSRDLPGDSRAHQNEVDAREDRAVERGESGRLDLGQQVDTNGPGGSLLGETHFDEVG
jgi:hypothetical protein